MAVHLEEDLRMMLADTHVHIYPFYDLGLFFSSAFRNLDTDPEAELRLFLTERFDCNAYQEICRREQIGEFRVERQERCITVISPIGRELSVHPGWQVITRERLEVLALDTLEKRPAEGVETERLIQELGEQGVFTILPWSLGKWSGERGRLVERLIKDEQLKFALGDPGHRGVALEPQLFRLGREHGRTILRGSDPLPLKGEERRVGSYGMKCSGLGGEGQGVGARVGMLESAWLQLRLRMG
jgi:hypothetical protein